MKWHETLVEWLAPLVLWPIVYTLWNWLGGNWPTLSWGQSLLVAFGISLTRDIAFRLVLILEELRRAGGQR